MEINELQLHAHHIFFRLIGYDYIIKTFIREMENVCIWLAENKFDKVFLKKIITDIIETTEITVETKLELINILSEN